MSWIGKFSSIYRFFIYFYYFELIITNNEKIIHQIKIEVSVEAEQVKDTMTKKENYELKENTAKVIFKNSNNTVCTYSKTCSGASQFFTKSLILQLKQNFPHSSRYEDNSSTKRDLSIETDYCILRTHLKKKLLTNRDAISQQKSKYSMNRTALNNIKEHNRDTSACGDSDQNFLQNTNLSINLTSLVVANLKNLLNDWIRSYLLDNNDTKEKIESVLDSILHQIDLQRNDTPSSHTYTLGTETDQNQHHILESGTFSTQDLAVEAKMLKTKNRKSSLSIPLSGKHLKIISTLSLPRNLHNMKKTKRSICRIGKFRHKRILVSSNNSSVYVFNSSNLDFLILRTNSLVKHCATYRHDAIRTSKNSPTVKKSDIYKHIACLNILSDSKSKIFCKKSLPSLKNDDTNLLEAVSKTPADKENKIHQTVQPSSIDSGKKQKKRSKKRISKCRYSRCFKSKKYTFLLKQHHNNKVAQQEKEIIQQFQNIFRYFSNFKGSNNFKLDVKVNIYPSQEMKRDDNLESQKLTQNADSEINNQNTTLVTQDVTSSKLSSEETEPKFDDHKNIISLLDSAASVTKYILTRESVTNVSNKQNAEDILSQNNNLKDSKVARDISELKTIVQSLATVTEKLITKHIEKKTETKASLAITDEKISKSVQFKNKSQIVSGLKLRKEPKKPKPTREYNPRLEKKATSYNIINSESILKVTDMTSTVEYTTATAVDEALTCSLPKSKSLFEVSIGSEKKLLAFYCDDYIHYSGFARPCNPSYISIPCRNTFHHIRPSYILKYSEDCMNATCTNRTFEPDIQCELCDDGDNCSSVCIDIEKSCERETVKRNRRYGFIRGIIAGALLWIPLTIILWALYFYVIKDLVCPPKRKVHRFNMLTAKYYTNAPTYHTFDDLGF